MIEIAFCSNWSSAAFFAAVPKHGSKQQRVKMQLVMVGSYALCCWQCSGWVRTALKSFLCSWWSGSCRICEQRVCVFFASGREIQARAKVRMPLPLPRIMKSSKQQTHNDLVLSFKHMQLKFLAVSLLTSDHSPDDVVATSSRNLNKRQSYLQPPSSRVCVLSYASGS